MQTKMMISIFQIDKLKIFIKRNYTLIILLLLLYSLYMGVNFKLNEYAPWKIEIDGVRSSSDNQITSEIPSMKRFKHPNLSSDVNMTNPILSRIITWLVTADTEERNIEENEAKTLLSKSSTTAVSLTTTTTLSTIYISTQITTLPTTTTTAVTMYGKSKIKIVGDAPYPRTYLEIFKRYLGKTNGAKDFQNKLVKYLKFRAKLNSGYLLSEYAHQIDPMKIAPEHQLSMFPEEVIVPFRISYPDKIWKGKQLPLMTAVITGRTGNIMGQYATMYALHRIYNVSVLMHPTMMNALSKNFPNLSIKEVLSDEDRLNSSLWQRLGKEGGTFSYGNFELAAAGLYGPKLFILGGYSYEVQLFHFFYEDIKKEFQFTTEVKKEAEEHLHSVYKLSGVTNGNVTYIGFHIRRTDYANHMKVIFLGTLPGDVYFELAMNYYRQKFKHPLFIVASDDTNFVQESIIGKQTDAYISKDKSTLVDMAILSSCNHSIITMGTYGFWGAYLAGGEVLYPVDSSLKYPYRLNDRLYHQMRLPNFTPIKF